MKKPTTKDFIIQVLIQFCFIAAVFYIGYHVAALWVYAMEG